MVFFFLNVVCESFCIHHKYFSIAALCNFVLTFRPPVVLLFFISEQISWRGSERVEETRIYHWWNFERWNEVHGKLKFHDKIHVFVVLGTSIFLKMKLHRERTLVKPLIIPVEMIDNFFSSRNYSHNYNSYKNTVKLLQISI